MAGYRTGGGGHRKQSLLPLSTSTCSATSHALSRIFIPCSRNIMARRTIAARWKSAVDSLDESTEWSSSAVECVSPFWALSLRQIVRALLCARRSVAAIISSCPELICICYLCIGGRLDHNSIRPSRPLMRRDSRCIEARDTRKRLLRRIYARVSRRVRSADELS